MVCKTNFGKIIGGYSPMKWNDYDHTQITGGKSFIYFYDEDSLRKCSQKEKASAYSDED